MNTFGNILRLTTWGESHGAAVGGVIDGFPSRVKVDFEAVEGMLMRRAPGHGQPGSTARREPDEVQWLSGLTPQGLTLGTPIAFMISNTDTRPQDYEHLEHAYRPGHADLAYQQRYGIRDPRGGGRASARETACRVVAGALCLQVLHEQHIRIQARVTRLGDHKDDFEAVVKEARRQGDTLGGRISCTITGCPPGIGEPLYDKLSARLAYAMMSIPAARAFRLGEPPLVLGSQYTDQWDAVGERTNHTRGILGGITTGQDINFEVDFRPIASMGRPVTGLTEEGRPIQLPARGRHDVTAVFRALPVVEAMAALTLLDHLLIRH